MAKKFGRATKNRNLIFFLVGSLVLIAILVYAAIAKTRTESFAYTPEQIEQFCQKRGFSEEQCDKLLERMRPSVDPEVKSWCNSKCPGGGLEGKICSRVCVNVNTGGTCQGQCNQYKNPTVNKRCTRQCPSLVKPTSTPTPTTAP